MTPFWRSIWQATGRWPLLPDHGPWFLVEAKTAAERLAPALAYFQQATGAAHAFQVVMNMLPVMADCFTRHQPTLVPALSFLSQLL